MGRLACSRTCAGAGLCTLSTGGWRGGRSGRVVSSQILYYLEFVMGFVGVGFEGSGHKFGWGHWSSVGVGLRVCVLQICEQLTEGIVVYIPQTAIRKSPYSMIIITSHNVYTKMQNQNSQPILRPVSQYIGKQNSLLEQALAHLPDSLPQPVPTLQSNLNYIPHHMMNMNLYKQIHSYNRGLILEEFASLCQLVVEVYRNCVQDLRKGVTSPFLGLLAQRLGNGGSGGKYYVAGIQKQVGQLRKAENQIEFVRNVMRNLALTHVEYYQLNSGNKQSYQQTRIPQKYEQTIDNKVNTLLHQSQSNYFENLILNPIKKNQRALKSQIEIQADAAADFLTNLFNQRHNVDAKEVVDKQKSFKPTSSTITFVPFVITHGKNSPPKSPESLPTSHQELLNNLLSIENQPQNKPPQLSGYPQLEFENWFTNTFSQMTYYESYMMAHMADLIFVHPQKFQIRYLKFQPYLAQLQRQVVQEINDIRSQEAAFCLLYQSKDQYRPINEEKGWGRARKYSEGGKGSKEENKFIDKAKNVFQDLYKKAKKELSKQKECGETSFDAHKFIAQNQNILLPQSPTPKKSSSSLINDLQHVDSFLQNLHELQKSHPTGLMQSLKHFASQLKNKIHDETPYYHEIQSWMAVVILLYKLLAMDPRNYCEYSPYKRRCIIRVCKRIFIQEKKSSKKNRVGDGKSNSFKNWPVVLKFLENNRPEILFDAQGSVNQKQVDRILKQLYSAINQKRLLGSSFGNLFQNIPNLDQSIPQIKLVCLSPGSTPNENLNKGKTTTQCKVVHILISGFLSQDTDKLEEWADMVDIMSDSEIYALVWESSTIKGLVKFFLKSAADVINAIKMIDQVRRKYTDNPFNPAFEVARITGRVLAELVIRLFPNRFVNICGYSLGTEVIKQFLARMIVKDKTQLINNIYLLGGVSDVDALSTIISQSQSPLSLYNCYTNNDSVLKHLLSLCKPDIKPIGLNQIKKVQGHSVTNIDCTKFISGHLAFRSNLRLMGEILELSTG